MLILSRRKNEDIVIGKDVRIRVLEIVGGQVRIGIESPKEVPAHRAEIAAAIALATPMLPDHHGRPLMDLTTWPKSYILP